MRPPEEDSQIAVRVQRRAVLLDRHPLWLEAIAGVLAELNIEVCAKALSSDEALALLQEHQPDLFVTEIDRVDGGRDEFRTNGDRDAFRTIRRARESNPDMEIAVVSACEDQQQIRGALFAGANVYVMKSAEPDDLKAAIRQTFSHSVYLAQDVIEPRANFENGNDVAPLTSRELEILALLMEGRSNAELANVLWVTEQTIKFHLSNIYRKLRVSNRTEASRWAFIHGVLGSGSR